MKLLAAARDREHRLRMNEMLVEVELIRRAVAAAFHPPGNTEMYFELRDQVMQSAEDHG